METYEKVSIITVAILVFLLWLGYAGGVYPLNDITSNIPFFIITAIFGVFLWGMSKRIENAVGKKTATVEGKEIEPYKPDPDLIHFAVHYVQINGAPETPVSARLRYVTNDRKREAFSLHELLDWLAPMIRQHKIMWYPYDDEKLLRKSLAAKYQIYDIDPTPERLGFKYIGGKWVPYEPYTELLDKLGNRKLEDLQLFVLTRRYFLSFKRRLILVKFPEKGSTTQPQVWLAPPYVFDLIEKRTINEEGKGMWFFWTCEKWCKHHHYDTTNLDRFYPESALLAEGT